MSCHLLPCLELHDVIGLRDYLYPNLKDVQPAEKSPKLETETPGSSGGATGGPSSSEGWDDDWGDWEVEKAEEDSGDTTPDTDTEGESTSTSHKWLQNCQLAVSPTADLVAVGKEDKLVLLAPKYVSEKMEEETTKYCTVWSGTVTQEQGEFITYVLCLPLASQKRSTQGAPDWTCVIVGFSSGYVRMYTETGTLLLSQKLHTEPVQKLKCKTYTPPRYLGIAEQHEELVILYMTALVTIDGFSLYQALKACRNQVARATASGESSLQPPPLAYKKWAPRNMESIVDAHTTGMITPNPFDQMVEASLSSHHSSIRPTPPAASVYLLTGTRPYLGFYYAVEGSAQPILSEVAFAVASKLKSALINAASGWLSFGSKGKTEPTGEKPAKIEPATALPQRFHIPDQRREGLCISLSPNNLYAATTDSFGRVILIDVSRGIATRMWKGYRDAQVGWVEVREDEGQHSSHSKQTRIAQFLVIYAARRGILEVWVPGNGQRVAAFNVSKHSVLVSICHGILGLNNVTGKGVPIKAFQVALLDQDGLLKTVQVPFHLALSDKNSKRVRDMHLLKKLKQMLKDNTEETDALGGQIKDILLNIKISSIVQQGIDRVVSTRYLSPEFMLDVIKVCVHRAQGKGEEHLDIERRLLLQHCQLQERLIKAYVDLSQLHIEATDSVEMQNLGVMLGVSENDVETVMNHLDHCHMIRNSQSAVSTGARVTFEADAGLRVAGFLSCFTCRTHVADGGHTGSGAITLAKDLTEEKKKLLGSFLFDKCFNQKTSASDVCAVLRNSGVPLSDIGKLLMWFWLGDVSRSLDHVAGLYSLMKIISHSLDESEVSSSRDQESPWWTSLREQCSRSRHCQPAFLAAMVTRGVTMEMVGLNPSGTGEPETTSESAAKDPDADTVSMKSEVSMASPATSPVTPISPTSLVSSADVEAWNLLIKQLEDLTCVDCLLQLSPAQPERVYLTDEISVCVADMLDGGKGCISEVVARHVARVGFQPEDLYRPIQEGPDDCGIQAPATQEYVVWDEMELLRKRFPHSLENDVVFSNCCWEYTVIWNKQPEEVDNLKVALDFLRLVQNAMLRQGVCSMMWHMFICKKFQATAQLMEKVGKVPKDRLCRKDIGISEMRLGSFISNICDFFTILMEANCETNEVPVFNLEPAWTKVKGSVSLVELAIDQKSTNYGLLTVYHQLATVMNAIISFNMKPVRPLSLFDSKGKHSLQQELHSHPLLPGKTVDTSVAVQRKQFLTRVISQSVMKIRELSPLPHGTAAAMTDPGSPSTVSVTKLKLSEAGRWPDTVYNIADLWGQDLDHLKRHHVCELYSAGFDKLAEEVLLTVNDHESLGGQLLTITGQRVSHKLSSIDPQLVVELMSNVNTALSTWIKAMNFRLLIQPEVDTVSIQSLLAQTLNYLPENHTQRPLATSLVDLVQVLP